jgi:2-phospho-L-lactate guanylyltransferase
MLELTLRKLQQVDAIGGILVISRDTAALSLARRLNVQTVQESGAPELNDALGRATNVVMSWNAKSCLILASDMPLITVHDIEALVRLSEQQLEGVVIATDRRKDGTNALLIKPPGLIPYRYGEHSFDRHIEEANAIGASIHVYESPTLALDVDVPDDLEAYRKIMNEQKLKDLAWLATL